MYNTTPDLTIPARCPYCKTEQPFISRIQYNRPVGGLVKCNDCGLTWRVTISIKNNALPEEQMKWREIYKERHKGS